VTTLYASSLEGQQIVKVDLATHTQTTFANTVGQPDSLIFTPSGDLVYTSISNG
jgi:sugar lactone lactonase YvrE